MKKIYIFLFSCVTVLSAVAQTTPNLYRAVDKEKMNHWVDSVFDAMSYDERIGQLFMVIANPKSDTQYATPDALCQRNKDRRHPFP